MNEQQRREEDLFTDRAIYAQITLASIVIGYTLLSPLIVAFFVKGHYFDSVRRFVMYIWVTPWTLCCMFTFVAIGLYYLIDGVKALIVRKYQLHVIKVDKELAIEMPQAVPVVIMQSSLKNVTEQQAIEALTEHLKQLGFIDFEQEKFQKSFGVQLIAKSAEGRFAFMIGGLSKTLTITDVESFATGRAYFDCHDALCIATENATKDAKRRASELFIPYIDADHYKEELQRYFASIRSDQHIYT